MIASLILEAAGTAGLMSASAGGGSSGGGAKSPITPSENKKMIKSIIEGPKEERKFFKEMLKSVAGKAGLSFSVSSMLRQSQIFTTMFGSLFQIIGAFIDIALAPLVPMMTDGLRWLVDQMPEFREKIQDWVDNKWPAIRIWFEEAYRNFDSWEWWKGQLIAAWGWGQGKWESDIKPKLTELWDEFIKPEIWDPIKTKVWDEGILAWWKTSDLKYYWDIFKLLVEPFAATMTSLVSTLNAIKDLWNIVEKTSDFLDDSMGGGSDMLFKLNVDEGLPYDPSQFLIQPTTTVSPALSTGGGGGVYGAFTGHPSGPTSDFQTITDRYSGAMMQNSQFTEAQRNSNDISAMQVVHGMH
jgi:hypothetical protein